MMMNPDVDSYAKTLNDRKIIQKMQKNNLLKNKRMLKPKYHLRWRCGFHIQVARGGISPLASSHLRIVLAYSNLSLLNCYKIRDGGEA